MSNKSEKTSINIKGNAFELPDTTSDIIRLINTLRRLEVSRTLQNRPPENIRSLLDRIKCIDIAISRAIPNLEAIQRLTAALPLHLIDQRPPLTRRPSQRIYMAPDMYHINIYTHDPMRTT